MFLFSKRKNKLYYLHTIIIFVFLLNNYCIFYKKNTYEYRPDHTVIHLFFFSIIKRKEEKKVYNDVFKLNFVEVVNKFHKIQKIYLDKQNEEVKKSFVKIQVNNKKFINCFIFNVKNEDLENRLKKLNFPIPNYIIKNKSNEFIQIVYLLSNYLNIYNKTIKSYYEDIYSSMLKHLKITPKNNDNQLINNFQNETLFEYKNNDCKSYILSDFKHLIIRDNKLSFKKNRYSSSNNYIFHFLNIYSLKNTYLILKEGKIIIENRGFELARELKEKNKLDEIFSVKDLKIIIDKIYDYVIENREELLKKYGNRGRYKSSITKYKSIKKRQQMSGVLSSKINASKKENLVMKTIETLLKSNQKITIKLICQQSNLSNKTVIKYYKEYQERIKSHNEKIKFIDKDLDDFIKNLF